jgi:hypothetical protein
MASIDDPTISAIKIRNIPLLFCHTAFHVLWESLPAATELPCSCCGLFLPLCRDRDISETRLSNNDSRRREQRFATGYMCFLSCTKEPPITAKDGLKSRKGKAKVVGLEGGIHFPVLTCCNGPSLDMLCRCHCGSTAGDRTTRKCYTRAASDKHLNQPRQWGLDFPFATCDPQSQLQTTPRRRLQLLYTALSQNVELRYREGGCETLCLWRG